MLCRRAYAEAAAAHELPDKQQKQRSGGPVRQRRGSWDCPQCWNNWYHEQPWIYLKLWLDQLLHASDILHQHCYHYAKHYNSRGCHNHTLYKFYR